MCPRRHERRLAPHLPKTPHRIDPFVFVIGVIVVLALIFLVGLPTAKIVTHGMTSSGIDAFLGTFVGADHAFFNSILLGLLAASVGTFIGFINAYCQVKLNFPGKKILHWLTLLPVISPPFAVATAVIILFGKRGIITHSLLGLNVDIYGLHGLVFVLAMTFAPVAYMNIKSMMVNLDPSHDEAAQSLGCSQAKILWTVTIPMVIPSLLSSFLIIFVESLADLANPLVLGGRYRVLASDIYFAVAGEGNIPKAAGVAISLLIPSIVIFIVQRYWASRTSVVTVTGKPAGRANYVEDRIVKIPMLTIMTIWNGLIALIYCTIIMGGFTKTLGINNTFTFDHYSFIWTLGSSAITTTMKLTFIAAPTATLLGVLIAWLVVRYLKKLGPYLDFFGMLGTAIPGTVLGLGFALAYAVPTYLFGIEILPPLAGGGAIGAGAIAIVMVFIARANPTAQQGNIAALRQINPQLEEAATSLGAGRASVLSKITLPLLTPSLLSGLTFGITKSMTTITAVVFIVTPQTKVMTAQILDEVDAGRLGNAFAYCSLLIVCVLIVLGVTSVVANMATRRFTSHTGEERKSS